MSAQFISPNDPSTMPTTPSRDALWHYFETRSGLLNPRLLYRLATETVRDDFQQINTHRLGVDVFNWRLWIGKIQLEPADADRWLKIHAYLIQATTNARTITIFAEDENNSLYPVGEEGELKLSEMCTPHFIMTAAVHEGLTAYWPSMVRLVASLKVVFAAALKAGRFGGDTFKPEILAHPEQFFSELDIALVRASLEAWGSSSEKEIEAALTNRVAHD